MFGLKGHHTHSEASWWQHHALQLLLYTVVKTFYLFIFLQLVYISD